MIRINWKLLLLFFIIFCYTQEVLCIDYNQNNQTFIPFETWKKSPHQGCTSFSGCLTMEDREVYLNPNSTSIPCGFMYPSDLDKVREYFQKDKTCKIIVYSFILGAYNYAYNPISTKNFLKKDKEICFFLFVDEITLMNGHGIYSLAPGQVNDRKRSHQSAIVGGNSTWQLILIKKFAASKNHGIAHISKLIKLNGLQLFPNAEWVIYVDTKYIINTNPRRLIKYIQQNTNHSISAYAHFADPVRHGFRGAIGRLYYQNFTRKDSNLEKEVQAIKAQYKLYEKEGLFNVYNDSNPTALIDSAIMIAHNDIRARRFFCGWQNEVSMFSRRDQLSFHTVQHRLQIFTYQIWTREMFARPNQFMTSVKSVHPPHLNMFNVTNPHPFKLHPSTALVHKETTCQSNSDDYLPFKTWKKSPHQGCTSFSGCLTMEDREVYLNPNSTSIPCGFMYPSDLDKVREYFQQDNTCKIVVFSLLMGAYNFAYNPISTINFLEEDKEICFFLFVDEITLMNGHGIWQLAPGQSNKRNIHRSAIVGGNSTWQLILIKNVAASKGLGIAHVSKFIKLNGLQLFPNAEWVMYVDTKYVVSSNPKQLIDYVQHKTNLSMAAYAHFADPVRRGFRGAIGRLYFQNSTRKNDNLYKEIQAIKDQYKLYEKEGLFKVYNDSNHGALIDAAILIARNDCRARRFYCSWQNEVSMFSRRDQLSFHTVQHRLQIFTYQIWSRELFSRPHLFMTGLTRIKPLHPPRWNMFNESNPHPFTLHPSTFVN